MSNKPKLKKLESLELNEEECPGCKNNTLRISQNLYKLSETGEIYQFSSVCSECGFNASDVEIENDVKEEYEIEVKSEEDLNKILIKSSTGKIKLMRLTEIGPDEIISKGQITTVKSFLEKVKELLEADRDSEDDKKAKKKLRNKVKKLINVLVGRDSIRMRITDKNKNSGIFG
ncbi:MAG: hypothetical protein ACOCRX_01175 [Candidatus Woesearchaeota archaeon]